MNALRPLFPIAPRFVALLATAAACGLVSGCVGNPFRGGAIDPNSPVAGDIARVQKAPAKFPSFASIPNPPTDVRPLAQYGRQAQAVDSAGQALQAATADNTWTLQNSEAFADQARKAAGPQLEPPKPGEAESFAKEQRQRATPPPPR